MIAEIDQSKLEMPNLEDLQICNNLLTSLDLSKIELSSLCQFDAGIITKCYLGENKLVSLILPEDLSNLEYMDLQKNNIVSLDLSNTKTPKLKYLDLGTE
jgi:Leucine-rich repeat (LRR) protein